MDLEQRDMMIDSIRKVAARVQGMPGFLGSEKLKAAYVSLVALEAALRLDSIEEFAEACANFCSAKEAEQIASN